MSGVLSRNSLEHAVAGSAGTVLASFMLFPLERIKTLMQVKYLSSGLREVLVRVLREEGPGGLYRGCTPLLQTVGASNFLYFFLFEGLKENLARKTGWPDGCVGPYETLASSALAGALNMIVTEPLWRASTIAQTQTQASGAGRGAVGDAAAKPGGAAQGAFGTVCRMWAAEGPAALWRGLASSLWLVSNPVIQFFTYNWLKASLGVNDISAIRAFVMGALAKTLATIMTFPLQVAQSRLRVAQTDSASCKGRPELQGMIPCLRAIVLEQGFRGLYFGILPKLLSTATQAAFMFAFYEKLHWVIRHMTQKNLERLGRRMKRNWKSLQH